MYLVDEQNVHRLQSTQRADEVAGLGKGGPGSRVSADPRSTDVAMRHGVVLRGRARLVRAEDFQEFDYIFAMDGSNLRDLRYLESESDGGAALTLFRSFDPDQDGDLDVPDPYYGGPDGFDLMFDMVDRTCAAFIEHLRSELSS